MIQPHTVTRQQAWKNARAKFSDPAFASCGTTLRPEHINVHQCGHHASIVFERGVRHYIFHGRANRDRFVNLYRPHGAKPRKDPHP